MAYSLRSCLIGLCFTSSTSLFAAEPIADAWNALLNNKSQQALELLSHAKDSSTEIDKYALLSIIHQDLGHADSSAWYSKKIIQSKNCPFMWTHIDQNLLAWTKAAPKIQEIISPSDLKTFAIQHPQHKDLIYEMLSEQANLQGKLKLAQSYANEIPTLRQWSYTGGYSNTTNKGWNKPFEPEYKIHLNEILNIDNKYLNSWTPIDIKNPNGWLRVDNYANPINSIYYFYSEIESPEDQNATLGFGHSGNFKIWLNDTLKIADPIVRNTGINHYTSPIYLKKGLNKILVKLGTYSKQSGSLPNFKLNIYAKNGFKNIPSNQFNGIDETKITSNTPNFTIEQPNLDTTNKSWNKYFKALYYTNSSQLELAKKELEPLLKQYPNSSLLARISAEIALRENNSIQFEQQINKAIKNNPQSYLAWIYYLDILFNQNDPESWNKTLESIPSEFSNQIPKYIVMRLIQALRTNDQSEVVKRIEQIKPFAYHLEILKILLMSYSKSNQNQKINDLLEQQLESNHGNFDFDQIFFQNLASKNEAEKAIAFLKNEHLFNPDANYYDKTLANISFMTHDLPKANVYVQNILRNTPYDSKTLQLQYAIARSQEDTSAYQHILETMSKYTEDPYTPFDLERIYAKKPMLWDILPQPNIEDLLNKNLQWNFGQSEFGSILHNGTDLLIYPNAQTRTRRSIIIYLPSQKAIEQWKEFSIPFNYRYQDLQILNAEAIDSSGIKTTADRNKNQLIFKSLAPKSVIRVEWLTSDQYEGDLRNQSFGNVQTPSWTALLGAQIRLLNFSSKPLKVNPSQSSTKSESIVEGQKVLQWDFSSLAPLANESHLGPEQKFNMLAQYSTLTEWKQISQWYESLASPNAEDYRELKSFADSLFMGAQSDWEKVVRVHQYITQNIRYSSVAFRQSGWIPQDPLTVLETKIGDCKDMASLASTLLKIAKVNASLVLLNTELKSKPNYLNISPNQFNHCILGVKINQKKYYVDLTASYMAPNKLPLADQGSFALWVDSSESQPVILPIDLPQDRSISRISQSVINDEGQQNILVKTLRKGVFSEGFRERYQSLSNTEQTQKMLESLRKDHVDAEIQQFLIDTSSWRLGDTAKYQVQYRFNNPQPKSGSLWIVPMEMQDALDNQAIPSGSPRVNDIDCPYFTLMTHQSTQNHQLKYPKTWKLLQNPQSQNLNSEFGKYSLQFKFTPGQIQYTRTLSINCKEKLQGPRKDSLIQWMRKVSASDQQQLLFQAN